MEMSRFETSLARLESSLKRLIEGEPELDGFPHKLHYQLEKELIGIMKLEAQKASHVVNRVKKSLTAPDHYTLIMPVEQAELLLTHPGELDRLAHKLEVMATQHAMTLSDKPIVRVVAVPESDSVKVVANFSKAGRSNSRTTEVEGNQEAATFKSANRIPKAYLVINGLKTYPLSASVINIGRDNFNQVQLDDRCVSRAHAQLRLIHGEFVIFDLDSTGGTFVNDMPVVRHTLQAGDVISLAGVPLVYGQEEEALTGYTQELTVTHTGVNIQ